MNVHPISIIDCNIEYSKSSKNIQKIQALERSITLSKSHCSSQQFQNTPISIREISRFSRILCFELRAKRFEFMYVDSKRFVGTRTNVTRWEMTT